MQSNDIMKALEATEIPLEDERAVPCNGEARQLPYMVVRKETIDHGDDAGRIRLQKISWTVALFTKKKEPELDRKIRMALANVGGVKITPYPDGTPYETNFEFKTTEIGGL